MKLPLPELAFDLLYLVFGGTIVVCLVLALELCGLTGRLAGLLRRAARSRALPWVLVGLTAAGASVARTVLLDRQPVADDEEVYLFTARTLLAGSVASAAPLDPEFVADEFVANGGAGRFGKYPIGHGLALAAAVALGGEQLFGPVLAGLTAALTWTLARRTVGRRRALAALALLALSPHFVWTHGTLLSQTSSTFFTLAALVLVERGCRRDRGGALVAAGAALGLACLTRPLPGAFVALVAAAAIVAHHRDDRRRAARSLALLAAPVALAAAALGLVQFLQTGSPLRSGYHVVHGGLGLFSGPPGVIGASLFGAVLRENFWLFGWPLSLAPVAFARPRRFPMLLWGPVVAVLAYRIVVPKLGVSTTGPVYLLEAVPLLAILAADGLARVAAGLRRSGGRARAARVPAAVVAGFAAAAALYLPIEAASVRRGAAARGRVFEMLAQRGVSRAVVFADDLVPARSGLTWARYPPIPSPRLDEDLLFLRLPDGPGGRARALALWRSRFADRPAFLFDSRPPFRLRRLGSPAPPR